MALSVYLFKDKRHGTLSLLFMAPCSMLWDMRFLLLCVKHDIFVWMCYCYHDFANCLTFLKFNLYEKNIWKEGPAVAGRAHGQYATTPSGRPFGRRAGRPRRITGHSLVFCSKLVRRRRRRYINRSARLSAGEVGLNLLGTTRTERNGPCARRASFMGRQIAIFQIKERRNINL